ncbi:MAG: FkbM family methyltransferase [Betaproteobacteria bacterium]
MGSLFGSAPMTILRKLRSLASRIRARLLRSREGNASASIVAAGNRLAQNGRYVDSIHAFQDAIRTNPQAANVWQGIGHVVGQAGLTVRLMDTIVEAVTEWSAVSSTSQPDDPDDRHRRRRGLPLGDLVLADFLPGEKFVILDGGAREAEADFRWSRLDSARLEIHGFEPEQSECARLNAHAQTSGLANHYYPVGLWSIDGMLPFDENHAGGGSSFMQQNRTVSDRWKFENPTQTALAREVFHVKRTYDVKVTSVDTWARANGISAIDFIKLNVQGGELEILRSSGSVLDSVLGLLIEVSFCESYVGRPFFTDIDGFLRANKFVFFDLLAHHYIGRADAAIAQQHLKSVRPKLGQLVSAWGQLIEGHALYLRDPIAERPEGPVDEVAARRALKLAVIAEIYGQIEFALELLHWVRKAPGYANTTSVGERAAQTYLRYY